MKNYINSGTTVAIGPMSEESGLIRSGDLVVAGAFVGVAVSDAGPGDYAVFETVGVFELPKDESDIGFGDVLFADAPVGGNVTTTYAGSVGDNTYAVGIAVSEAGPAATTVRVLLRPMLPPAA